MEMEQPQKLDENLYSRQIGTYGMETMSKLIKMKVLILGMKGLGVETAKNLVLAGPQSVTIWDPSPCTERDMGTNFYITQNHVNSKVTRAEASLKNLTQLNPYVSVSVCKLPSLSDLCNQEVLNNFDIVVSTDVFDFTLLTQINEICRSQNKGFILSACKGLLGMTFVDFTEHVVFDKNGEQVKSVLISNITKDGVVTTQEDKRHDLEDGDIIKMSEVVGLEGINGKELVVKKVLTPYTLQLEDITQLVQDSENYVRNGILEEVKAKIKLSCNSLSESLQTYNTKEFEIEPDMDFMKPWRLIQIKYALNHMLKNQSQYFPQGVNVEQRNVHANVESLKELFVEEDPNKIEEEKQDEEPAEETVPEWKKNMDANLMKYLLAFWNLEVSPMTAFWGGIVAQEIVKYTGKYSPINQWMIHEFYSTVFKHKEVNEVLENLNSQATGRHQDQILLFGQDIQNQIEEAKLFMIGAGALGCEYLKLFALMGFSTNKNGLISVTDDDTIEISNLNRQFLFRKEHVGSSKSDVAVQQAVLMNPSMNSVSYSQRVEPKNETVFTDKFFDSQTFIVNAVDNIKARMYVDGKAVLHKKWLFEAGTLGTKCNSQIVIPDKTESYADSSDPEEKHIPMCTLRNFPFLIEHCIEWARERFFSTFSTPSKELSDIQKNRNEYFSKLLKESKDDGASVVERLQGVSGLLQLASNPSLKNMILFARDEFQKYFHDSIQKLLILFPKDYVDKEGNLFWRSPKRAPGIMTFDSNNRDHLNYIRSILNILQQIFKDSPQSNLSDEELKDLLNCYIAKENKILNAEEERKAALNKNQDDKADVNLEDQIKELKNLTQNIDPSLAIEEVEFEKDDDSNGHINFITFTSNFRAFNYEITQATRHKIKMIAGKIIPAIATTTAMVVGAMGIEFYKFFLNCPSENMRNFFSNLGISMINFSEPMPPVVAQDKDYDPMVLGPIKAMPPKWNTWSRIEIKGNNMKVHELKEKVEEMFSIEMEGLSIGKSLVWNSFGQKPDYSQNTVEDAFRKTVGDFYEGKKYVVLTGSAVDKECVDLNLPFIVYVIDN